MSASASTAATRAAINRSNAQRSTGPRTGAGKERSSRNALRHGLTAQTAVLPTEDPAAYQYKPATATETQLVQEFANTAWRLNRIPLLEADLLARASDPPDEQAAIAFDIVDAHRALATLGMHGQRLSRQFQKTVEQLRSLQAERREREKHDLKEAAALLDLHKYKGIPWEPAEHGFVFSKEELERFLQRQIQIKQSHGVEYSRMFGPQQARITI